MNIIDLERQEPRPSLLMRPREVASALGLSVSKTYALLAADGLPGVIRINGSVRVHRRTLEAWLADQATIGRETGGR